MFVSALSYIFSLVARFSSYLLHWAVWKLFGLLSKTTIPGESCMSLLTSVSQCLWWFNVLFADSAVSSTSGLNSSPKSYSLHALLEADNLHGDLIRVSQLKEDMMRMLHRCVKWIRTRPYLNSSELTLISISISLAKEFIKTFYDWVISLEILSHTSV